MRLGGIYDNAMKFFDAKHDEPKGPSIKLGDVFYNAAEALIEKKFLRPDDYILAAKYLIESAEHASESDFHEANDITDNSKHYTSLINKLKKIVNETNNGELKTLLESLEKRLRDPIKFRLPESAQEDEEGIIKILNNAFKSNSNTGK